MTEMFEPEVDTTIPGDASKEDRDGYQEFLGRCLEHKSARMSFKDWKEAWEELQQRLKYGYPA